MPFLSEGVAMARDCSADRARLSDRIAFGADAVHAENGKASPPPDLRDYRPISKRYKPVNVALRATLKKRCSIDAVLPNLSAHCIDSKDTGKPGLHWVASLLSPHDEVDRTQHDPRAAHHSRQPVSAEQYFIITGASGAGKSTLLDELHFLGYSVVPEAARRIIREQLASGGQLLPWLNPSAFIAEVLARSIQDHEAASSLGAPVFFDRAIPEVRMQGVRLQSNRTATLKRYRYNKRVFVAKPWQAIYINDFERLQDYDTSIQWYEKNIAAYTEAGYELCYIPEGTVRERVEFVLARTSVNA